MAEPDYEPRRDDHLVEPMFAGLGVEGGESEPRGPLARAGARLYAFVRRLFGRSGAGRHPG